MMMKVLRLLKAFLEGAGLPVYLAGQVPAGVAGSYAVLACTVTQWGQESTVEVTGWYHETGANVSATEFLDRMVALIPESGVLLDQRVWLLRGTDFLSLVTDGDAVGGRVRLVTKYYMNT